MELSQGQSRREVNQEEVSRLNQLKIAFNSTYGYDPDIAMAAPGRAEIIGCHTDYNAGYSIASALPHTTIALFKKRDDRTVNVCSTAYEDDRILSFSLDGIERVSENTWTNYVRSIFYHIEQEGVLTCGADIFIDTTVPISGGLSSSASIEVVTALGLLKLAEVEKDPLWLASICQKAENEFIGVPCGLLDQASIVFGQENKLTFMDFLNKDGSPISEIDNIALDVKRANLSFVIVVDESVKRRLSSGGYAKRRQMCEDSLPFWKDKLNREVPNLRGVSTSEFNQWKDELEKIDPVMCMRVEHVVNENQRVLDSISALNENDYQRFGELLTESGRSSIYLYDLAENTPELKYIFDEGVQLPGVLGIRNMGGGFSALALALVENDMLDDFSNKLNSMYKSSFESNLNFIPFYAANGARELSL